MLKNKIIDKVKEYSEDIEYSYYDTAFEYDEVESICEEYIYNYSNYILSEYISEYSDSLVNIYCYDIYKNAEKFGYWTVQAIQEFGIKKETELYQILQMGEYMAYSDALYSNIEQMGKKCACNNLIDWIETNNHIIENIEKSCKTQDIDDIIDGIDDIIDEISEYYINDKWNMGDIDNAVVESLFNINE